MMRTFITTPRPVVRQARPLTHDKQQHRQALATVQRERQHRIEEAMQITAIRRTNARRRLSLPVGRSAGAGWRGIGGYVRTALLGTGGRSLFRVGRRSPRLSKIACPAYTKPIDGRGSFPPFSV